MGLTIKKKGGLVLSPNVVSNGHLLLSKDICVLKGTKLYMETLEFNSKKRKKIYFQIRIKKSGVFGKIE